MTKPHSTFSHQNTLIRFEVYCLIVLMLFLIPSSHIFATNGINTDSSTELAIKGYDPVAYFTDSKAIKGKKEFTIEYNANKWAFSSATNKQTFLANPELYIPQYGGYCAFAAGHNSIADIDPQAWTIHNQKLYLNYSIEIRDTWLKDKEKLIIAADRNWPKLVKQVP